MSLGIGDTVYLIHIGEQALIVGRDSDELFIVDLGGDEIPVFVDDMIPWQAHLKASAFEAAKKRQKTKTEVSKATTEMLPPADHQYKNSGVHLALVPADEEISNYRSLKIHLVNDTRYSMSFHFQLHLNKRLEFKFGRQVNAHQSYYLTDIFQDQINESPKMRLQVGYVQKGKEQFFEASVKIKAKNFFKKYTDTPLLQCQSHLYGIFKPAEEKTSKQQNKETVPLKLDVEQLKTLMFEKQSSFKTHDVQHGSDYIDLHIENIVHNIDALTDPEKISLQLETFETYLDRALANNYDYLTIVHGIGKGTLRKKIHQRLKQHPHVRKYTNEYDHQHGLGGITIAWF